MEHGVDSFMRNSLIIFYQFFMQISTQFFMQNFQQFFYTNFSAEFLGKISRQNFSGKFFGRKFLWSLAGGFRAWDREGRAARGPEETATEADP